MINIIIILLMLIIIYIIPIKIIVDFRRENQKDNLIVKLGILFINYKLNISYLDIKRILSIPTIQLHSELKGFLIKNSSAKVYEELNQQELNKIHDFFNKVYRISKRFESFLFLTHNCKYFSWKTSFGLHNSAHTGMFTGLLWGLKNSILSVMQNYLKFKSLPIIEVKPNFNQVQPLLVEFEGIFVFKLGDIILIILKIVFYEIKRRIKGKWLTIQLKH